MMRSLYSAITGLKNHQTSMDVIGNNISNVNTAGYKRQRASFATMLGQEIRGASAPNATGTIGGLNGVSVGLGMVLGSVDKIMGQGSSQYTGKATDMMIQGEGMFVLNLSGENRYTRTGNFDFDKGGYLIDPSTGAYVMGYTNSATVGADDSVDIDPVTAGTQGDDDLLADIGITDWGHTATPPSTPGKIRFKLGDELVPGSTTGQPGYGYTLSSYSIGQDGVITGVYSNGTSSLTKPMYKIAVATFANQAGLTPEGSNYYAESNNSGSAEIGSAGTDGRGLIMPNYIEMSNVDLSQEFTDMIVTQRGFQANSRVITVSDSLLQELIDLKRG